MPSDTPHETGEYDARDLRVRETFPPSGGRPDTKTTSYDPGRRLASRTDQAGDTVSYEHDRADRLVRRRYPDRLDDGFQYDHASRLVAARSERYGTLVQRRYDRGGRLTDEHQHLLDQSHALRYGYDRASRQVEVRYPDGSLVERTFTDRDQLETASLDRSRVAAMTYDPGMRHVETTLGNGLVERRRYDQDDRLSELEVPGVTKLDYVYDANKRKREERVTTAPAEGQGFRYDAEGRVVSWARGGAVETQTWNLSLVGDWQRTQRDGAVEVRAHNPVHELTAVNRRPLAYDPKGNLVRDHRGSRPAVP